MVQPRRRNVRGSDEDGSAPRRSFLSAGQRQDKAAPCALGVPSSPECSGFASWRKTSWSRARWHGSYPERVGSGCTSQPDPESFRLELFSSFDTNTSLKFLLLFPCAQHHFDPPAVDQHRVFWAHPGCVRSLLGKLHLKHGQPHNWVPPAVEDRSLSGVQLLSGCIFFSVFTQSLLSAQVSCSPALPREALLDRGVSVRKMRAAVLLEFHLNVGFSRESLLSEC